MLPCRARRWCGTRYIGRPGKEGKPTVVGYNGEDIEDVGPWVRQFVYAAGGRPGMIGKSRTVRAVYGGSAQHTAREAGL